MAKKRVALVLSFVALSMFFFAGHSEARFLANPVDCYAVLVVAADDTNSTIKHNLDPVDVNGAEVTLARVYAVLKESGYKDSNIIVLYWDGRLQPDWSEKKMAKYFKMLKKHHFSGQVGAATKDNINAAVDKVKQKLDDNDQFVFWIICHGAANGTLMLARRQQWSSPEIGTTFTGLKSKTNFILVDSCYSGKILVNIDVENAVMVTTTTDHTPGWIDRNFSNCAYFMESKINKKLDKNKDGIVDCKEAFNATTEYAKKYEGPWREYVRTKYKPPKPVPAGLIDKTSIMPQIEVGNGFVKGNIGPETGGKKPKKSRPARPRRKGDPGEALMRSAKLYEEGQDWITAIDTYKKIAKMGSKSRHSKAAAKKVEKLLSDEKIAAIYKEAELQRQLDGDLAMAESYMLAAHYDRVIEYCEKVIAAAPDSKQAKSAKLMISSAKAAQKAQGG